MRVLRLLVLGILALLVFPLETMREARGEDPRPVYGGDLIDVHCHVKPGILTLPELAEAVQKAGMKKAVVFLDPSGKGPATLPDVFVRFLHPPVDREAQRPVYDDETVALFAQRLGEGGWKGIGELSLRHRAGREVKGSNIPADSPVVLKILDLAAKHRVPVNVHVEDEFTAELERALAHNREATVIWAHLGDAPAATLARMMKAHPNLYADLSCRHSFWRRGVPAAEQSLTTDDGMLAPEWKAVFEAYPDRFLFATDIGGGAHREDDAERLVALARSILGQLRPETAEMIGHRNAERLLGMGDRK